MTEVQGRRADPTELLENGLRLLLTSKCNYSCFFCHNEGLDPAYSSSEGIDPHLVQAFVGSGVRDITFSGGEPLLRFSNMKDIIRTLAAELRDSEKENLSVTVVTNGSLLSEEKVEELSAFSGVFRNIRLNVSLHGFREEVYDLVTGTEDYFHKVERNIRYAQSSELDVKLNLVLLREHNAESELIDSFMDYCGGLGIDHCKVIEFLVTDLNRDYYSNYSRLEPIIYNNRYRARLIERFSGRKTTHTYIHDAKEISVDYCKCTCALGCFDGCKTRELEIAPGNRVIGCIALPPIQFDPECDSPIEIASIAAAQIDAMVARYGRYSPSVAEMPKHIAGKAIFKLVGNDSLARVFGDSLVVKYRQIRESALRWKAREDLCDEYEFSLVESPEETHSVISCFRKKYIVEENIGWTSIEFFDAVYDFSRTRAEINRKKIEAMGMEIGKTVPYEDRTVILFPEETVDLAIALRTRTNMASDSVSHRLEISRPGSESWPEGEPLLTLKRILRKHDLRLQDDD